jgi:hypothetical protein
LAASQQPLRRRILQALATREGDYAALCAHWEAQAIPPPSLRTFSYHASKLHRAGLLHRRREGTRIVWSLAVDLPRSIRHGQEVHRPRSGPGHGNPLWSRDALPPPAATEPKPGRIKGAGLAG